MLTKRTELYAALQKFYNGRLHDNYVKKYCNEFIFGYKSNAFWEIVYNAACFFEAEEKMSNEYTENIFSVKENNIINAVRKVENEFKDKDAEDKVVKLKENIGDTDLNRIFQEIILDEKVQVNDNANDYQNLIKEFRYYCTVEKDFATIINPNKVGIKRFSRLINYFWSAYFSILIPILTYPKYIGYISEIREIRDIEEVDNYYDYLLNQKNKGVNNLEDLIKIIYSENFLEMICEENYYDSFRKHFDISYALTTNYTPFVRKLKLEKEDNKGDVNSKYAFLAGELSDFETPNKFEVVNILEEKMEESDFVFPFLYTQAPIKPIIEQKSVNEYAKAIRFLELEKVNYLVVVGYSLSDSDNHINSLLHNFAKTPDKKLVYCKYQEKDKNNDYKAEKRNVKEKLKLKDENTDNIIVMFNDGNPENLSKLLQKELSNSDSRCEI